MEEGFKTVIKSLKTCQTIADLGSGLTRIWWHDEIKENSTIDAFDVVYGNSKPHKSKNFERINYHARDIANLKEEIFKEKFDLIVAHNILEHVRDLDRTIESINWISKKGAILHILVPDSEQPTDIFYRLIHENSGGHIQKFKKDKMIKLIESGGWEFIESVKWFDDWGWFERLYDPLANNRNVTKEEIKLLANVLKKEITEKTGYYYGKEYVFKKIKGDE